MTTFSHVIVLASAGLLFISAIAHLSRRGRLSMRYTLGWLSIGFLSLLYPLVLIAASEISTFLGVQQLAVFLGMPLIILILVCVQLSISVSGLLERTRTLSESLAILEEHVSAKDPEPGEPKEH